MPTKLDQPSAKNPNDQAKVMKMDDNVWQKWAKTTRNVRTPSSLVICCWMVGALLDGTLVWESLDGRERWERAIEELSWPQWLSMRILKTTPSPIKSGSYGINWGSYAIIFAVPRSYSSLWDFLLFCRSKTPHLWHGGWGFRISCQSRQKLGSWLTSRMTSVYEQVCCFCSWVVVLVVVFESSAFSFIRNRKNYQHSTEGQKIDRNSAPVLVMILGKSLVFSRKSITSTGFLPVLRLDASAPVVVKNQSPTYCSFWASGCSMTASSLPWGDLDFR